MLTAYHLGPAGRYQRIEPDHEGRLLSETTKLLFGVAEDGRTLRVVDAVTGETLRTKGELEQQAARDRTARQAEAAARQAAEERAARAEQQATREAAARKDAEHRAAREAAARQEAEAELARLRAELERRGKP